MIEIYFIEWQPLVKILPMVFTRWCPLDEINFDLSPKKKTNILYFLQGPILTYLKTQFYKYPWIDQKHENEIKVTFLSFFLLFIFSISYFSLNLLNDSILLEHLQTIVKLDSNCRIRL